MDLFCNFLPLTIENNIALKNHFLSQLRQNAPLESTVKKHIQKINIYELSDELNFLEETIQNNTDYIIS